MRIAVEAELKQLRFRIGIKSYDARIMIITCIGIDEAVTTEIRGTL